MTVPLLPEVKSFLARQHGHFINGKNIEAGTVWVNMHTLLDPAVPFGGLKSSGMGREFGDEFIHDYTELKSVMIRY